MSANAPNAATPRTALEWSRRLADYRTPNGLRASREVAVTIIPFVICWGAMAWSQAHGYWLLYAAFLLQALGFLVRLFLIQHDCGHNAFFPDRRANDWVGRTLGVLTLTPYY